MKDNFLNINQAAKMLGVTPLTLRNWDKSGKFTASRHPINNYRVYRKEEVEMLIDDIKTKRLTTKKIKNQVKKLSIKHENDW
jgi:DNA-binding transcriptional MerR regulator